MEGGGREGKDAEKGAQKEGDSIRNCYAKNEKKRAEIWEYVEFKEIF